MSILKNFLADPTAGLMRGVQLSEVFANRERQRKLMELKSRGIDVDQQNANTNTGKLAEEVRSNPINERLQQEANDRERAALAQRAQEHADEMPRWHEKNATQLRSTLIGNLGREGAAVADDPNQSFLQMYQQAQRAKHADTGTTAAIRQRALTDGALERGANKSAQKLTDEFSLRANGLGRYSPSELTENARLAAWIRLNQQNMMGKPNFKDEFIEAMSHRLQAQPQQQTDERSILEQQLQTGEITKDMIRADPELKDRLLRYGLIRSK